MCSRVELMIMYIDCGSTKVRLLWELSLVVVEGGMATQMMCCAESQITGSPPLLVDCLVCCVCMEWNMRDMQVLHG